MLRKTLLKSITAAMLLGATTVVAEERTFVETFISQVKENNQFVTVGDIWAPDNNFDLTEMRKMVDKAQPLSIDYARLNSLMQKKPYAISLVLPGADGQLYTIEMAQYQVLANDFEVHAHGANNSDKKVDYTPGLYYRGVVKGAPGSVAAFSFFNNEVWGIFSIPGVGNIVVAPNTMVGKEYDYNPSYVLYNDADLKIQAAGDICSTDQLPVVERNRAAKTTTTLNNKVYNSCKQIRWYHVADYAMYVKKGTSTTNCTNYITSLFNNNGVVYMNEGVPIQLKYVQINTATDEYQSLPTNSSSAWLTKFGQVTQDVMHGCDLAMLLTTKGGSMGGIAWLDVLCASYTPTQHAGPYAFTNISNSATVTTTAFPTYSWDVEATSHEMGHNLGSRHTHACVWGPSRTTAIDACTTLEGSCANPGVPSSTVKGTIMSYCHLMSSVGINLANGFGQQPGDTVRHCINTAINTCGEIYKPNVALAKANRTITADRECTDVVTGITYYYKNGGTVVNTDDTLVLMVKKNGNNIGNMNNSAFSVSTTTLTGWGGGTAPVVMFPSGTSGVAAAGSNYAARRFWKISHTGAATLSSAVDVYVPMLGADTTDVNGSAPGVTAPFTSFRMYNIKKTGINPDPSAGFSGATAADIAIYSKGASASTTNWAPFTSGSSTLLAQYKTTNLYGGGAFFPYGLTSVGNVITKEGLDIFPNPTTNDWNIMLEPGLGDQVGFQLFSADGRLCLTQTLSSGTVNTIQAAHLPAGMYFYRVVNEGSVVTGNLMKN